MESQKEHSANFIEVANQRYRDIMALQRTYQYEEMYREYKGESFVLQFLMNAKGPVHPSDIRDKLQSSQSRISSLLGALEKKGLILREIDVLNRRNILVTITPEGIRRKEDEIKNIDSFIGGIFAEMGEKDTNEYLRLTEKFYTILNKHTEPKK